MDGWRGRRAGRGGVPGGARGRGRGDRQGGAGLRVRAAERGGEDVLLGGGDWRARRRGRARDRADAGGAPGPGGDQRGGRALRRELRGHRRRAELRVLGGQGGGGRGRVAPEKKTVSV